MTRIGADTTHLYETVAVLRQGSSNIESALRLAIQSMEALQGSRWSGQHRQQAEAIWARIQGQFVPAIDALNELAARTERFANALEEAGRVFGNESNIAGTDRARRSVSGNGADHTSVIPPGLIGQNKMSPWRAGIKFIKEIKDIKERLECIRDLMLISTLDFKRGFTYKDQVIIYGSRKAKEAAYLKAATTHMKGGLWNALAKQAPGMLKEAGKTALITAAFEAVDSGLDNWEKYKDDSQAVQKTAVATVIDAGMTGLCVGIGTGVGSVAGAVVVGGALGLVSGGTLAPLGVAVGAKVGGFIGGMAGELVADKIKEGEWYTQIKETWVQQGADWIDKVIGADRIDKVINEGKSLVDAGKKITDDGIQFVNDTTRMIDTKVRSLFGWRGS